jgi:diacylglycerol O-acyltransferase
MSTDEFPFSSLKEAARRRRATVNDFVLASAAGGLTQVLAKRGQVPDEILVDTPVSLRGDGKGARSAGNHLGHLFPILPLNLEPVETLQLVKAQMRAFKTTNAGARFEGVLSTMGLLPTALRRPMYKALLTHAPGPSAIVTNVPGPPTPIYILGAPVVGIYPFVSPTAGVGLSVAVTTYNDLLSVVTTADSRLVPDPTQFIEGFSNYMTTLIGR